MYRPTNKSFISRYVHSLWLRSPERTEALKRDKYTCQICGVKASKKKGSEQKVQVHHKRSIGNMDEIVKVIKEQLLCEPDFLITLCPTCHKQEDDKRYLETMNEPSTN